jgi:ATP-dependent helicase/nuclease subunit B
MAIRSAVWSSSAPQLASNAATAIRALQADDPLSEVIVVVPPGSTAATLRQLLPQVSGGVASIRFVTPIDLAVELVDVAISTQRAVTAQLQLAAIRTVLAGPSCPTPLLGVRDHAATINALADMARTLRAAHHHNDAMATIGRQPVRQALLQVVREARALLVAQGIRDESATLAAADHIPADAFADLQVVLVVTDTFHPAQLAFLRRLVDEAHTHIVATVPDTADGGLRAQLAAIGVADSSIPISGGGAASAVRVVSCPDPDEEVRHAVRACAALIDGSATRRPVPADDITIVCAHSSYRRPVRDELQRAGIAWSGPAIEQLRGSIAGQALRALVDGAIAQWDRVAVFRLLAVAPAYPIGDRAVPRAVSRWTKLCRRVGLVKASEWDGAVQALTDLHMHERRHKERYGPLSEGLLRQQADDLVKLQSLLKLVGRLRHESGRLAGSRSWTDATTRLLGMLADHIGTDPWRELHWATAPSWQRSAALQVEQLVETLAELDHDGLAVPFSIDTLQQVLSTLLEGPVRRRGDSAGAVAIVDIAAATCLDAQHILVLGANEGVLPPTATDDLLLDRDLPGEVAAVVEGPRHRVARAQRAWHAIVTSGVEVTVSFARTDLRRGGELYPSLLLADLLDDVQVHQSHAEGLTAGTALTVAEQLVRNDSGSRRLARRRATLTARQALEPTEYDGIVGDEAPLPTKRGDWAITQLEQHATCGLRYFGTYVLGLREEVDAVAITAIEPIDRGNLVHNVLEHLVGEWMAIPARSRPPWLQGAHLDAQLLRAVELLDLYAQPLESQNKLGHTSSWLAERAQILRSIESCLRDEADAGTQPLAAEYNFSGLVVAAPTEGDHDGSAAGVPHTSFHGKIDRIDVLTDGALRVTDFKTGKASIRTADPLEGGRKLQLPMYAIAADRDRGDLFGAAGQADPYGPRPVDPAALQLALSPSASARYLEVREGKATPRVLPLDDTLRQAFAAQVGRLLGEIGDGLFPPRVHSGGWGCPMCAPDDLGLGDVDERIRLFPGNVGDAEGTAGDDGDGE